MKTTTVKTKNGTHNAQSALAEINQQIQALHQQRIGLAEPLKASFGELRTKMLETQKQIRELDPNWKPASLTPKADEKIAELIAVSGPMTESEITAALAGSITKWKVKQTLKKKFSGDASGKYSVKA